MDVGMEVTVALLFLHGIGGPLPYSDWLGPLNHELGVLGYRTIDPDSVIAPAYDDLLKAESVPAAAAPGERQSPAPVPGAEEARDDFEYRRQQLSSRLAPVMGVDSSVFSAFPEGDYLASRLPQVRAYMEQGDRRHLVWQRVLESLGDERELIILAHSLGTAIAADLLDRLPRGSHVRGLVTMGSPLGAVPGLRRRIGWLSRAFPYTLVDTWVNVFDPRDPITGGRGLARHITPVVDVPILINRHAALAYCNHPAAATAIGFAMQDPDDALVREPRRSRRPDAAWAAALVRFGFAQQLTKSLAPTDARRKHRLTLARNELARRSREELDGATAAVEAAWRRSRGAERVRVGEARSILRWAPTEQELSHHALDLLPEPLKLDDMIVASISLLSGRPLPPFEVDTSTTQRRDALVMLLERVGHHSPPLAPSLLADSAGEAIARATREIVKVPRPLAATAPLGLLASRLIGAYPSVVPTDWPGVAHAAAQRATLGPDGFAAGLSALSMLTQGGEAPLAAAVVERRGGLVVDSDRIDVHMRRAVSEESVEQLQMTLVSLLAVLMARQALGTSMRAQAIRQVVLVMLHEARGELAVHDRVAPGSRTTRVWKTKVRMLERAERWLDVDQSSSGP